MTFDCILLALTELTTGRLLSLGLVCPQLPYAGILRPTGLTRRHASTLVWRQVSAEVADHIPAGPLPLSSPLQHVIGSPATDPDVITQYVSRLPVRTTSRNAAVELDLLLVSQGPVRW